MSKQVDFDFRVYPVGNTEGNYNHLQLSEEIRTQYLQNGWDVLKTEVSQVSANVIFLAVTFVKYAPNLGTPIETFDGTKSEEKRGPGRPKKVEEVVPA